jgi:drug/metabolite transporter (DMT)-like permease
VSPGIWTLIGALAIPLWATWPALSLRTREMPAFECLTLIFLVASLVLGVIERPVARVDAQISTWRPWIPALAFAVGESGSAVCFLLATHYIPAAEANLIAYLWPGMIAGIGAVLGLFRLRIRHVTGIALGFAGAAILMAGGTLSVSFTGMGLALLSGVAWAIYCIFRLTWREPCGNLLARGFALSTILCGIMHLLLEPSVMPTLGGAAAAGVVGIVPAACANLAWDEGFRRGDSQLLAVMAYATPLVSALLLTVLGLESFTWRLLIGAVVIGLAGVLSRADP